MAEMPLHAGRVDVSRTSVREAEARMLGDLRFPVVIVKLAVQWPQDKSPFESESQAINQLGKAALRAIESVTP